MKKYMLNKEDALLFIIDIQERLVPVMKYGEKVIKNNLVLIEASKELKMPVILTEQYPKGLGSTVSQISKAIDDNAKVFEKTSFTGYIDDVKKALEESGKKKVIITGMETHVCVFQTVRDLLANGYEVFIVKDGVASRKKDNFLNALDLMKSMGAVIMDTETILFDLLKTAGTPEFKSLSKLIK